MRVWGLGFGGFRVEGLGFSVLAVGFRFLRDLLPLPPGLFMGVRGGLMGICGRSFWGAKLSCQMLAQGLPQEKKVWSLMELRKGP